jgi:hypothetical protein
LSSPNPPIRPSSHYIGKGDILCSDTGRVLSPVPDLRMRTDRSAYAAMRRLNEWLSREAKAEAEANPGKWLAPHFDPKNMSPADNAAANLILFGDDRGPADRHRINPAVVDGRLVEIETR